MSGIPDADARREAVSTFNRTVLVTAGAGTGKTELLRERILNILFNPGLNASMRQIVALTFTRKAAGEMRCRIREGLQLFALWGKDGETLEHASGPLAAAFCAIRERYALGNDTIRRIAEQALATLEHATISTMHSFAGQLLRRYPLESGVDPAFREDEGEAFRELFRERWTGFLETELCENTPRAEQWHAALDAFSLEELEKLARRLCDEETPLERVASDATFTLERNWLAGLKRQATELRLSHDGGKAKKPVELLAGAEAIFEALLTAPEMNPDDPAVILAANAMPGGKATASKAWAEEDVEQVNRLAETARVLGRYRPQLLKNALAILLPFARSFREAFVQQGYLSFSALLVRARNLLRDFPAVRADVKRQVRHLLVDEFQDTDPIQYEIVFYLAESPDSQAATWTDAEPEPGKLFIVGDPKQSIYSFRGADMRAYHEVADLRLSRADAKRLSLVTNFRSCDTILHGANAFFSRIITENPGVQPSYEALRPRPGAEATLPAQRIEIRLATPAPEAEEPSFAYVEDATAAEAGALASWLRREVIGIETLPGKNGEPRPVAAGDIAILLRKMTGADAYMQALAAQGIPYVAEGEKTFFVRSEVAAITDLVQALACPHDRLALAGVLRSPLGGCTDRDLAELARALPENNGSLKRTDLMHYLDMDDPETLLPVTLSDRTLAAHALRTLHDLRQRSRTLPLGELLEEAYRRFCVPEMAAAFSGEQGAANAAKILRMAVAFSDKGLIAFAKRLRESIREVEDEGEGALAEDGQNAVRILTMHKSKGLEFPFVILPGLHAGSAKMRDSVEIRGDWATQSWSLRVGGHQTPSALRQEEARKLRDDAEERRIFYVAATRARERLVLSAALLKSLTGNHPPLFWKYLGEALPLQELPATETTLACAGRSVRFTPTAVSAAKTPQREEDCAVSGIAPQPFPTETLFDPSAFAKRLHVDEQRIRYAQLVRQHHRMARPSGNHHHVVASDPEATGDIPENTQHGQAGLPGEEQGKAARFLGTLAHRAMERLDFQHPDASLPQAIKQAAEHLGEIPDAVLTELHDMLHSFIQSDAFAVLAKMKELGREIPCLFPWEEGQSEPSASSPKLPPAAVEGAMDLLAEVDGRLIVVDYKTDRVAPGNAGAQAATHARQGQMYAKVVREALGRDVAAFRVVFLRLGVFVDLPMNG